jgi:hypothetical protein
LPPGFSDVIMGPLEGLGTWLACVTERHDGGFTKTRNP